MTGGRRILVLGLALSLPAVAACSEPLEADATGAEIFQQICARCHGADLEGGIGPALGPGSHAAGEPDEYLETTILRGRGRMPSFQSELSPEQVDAVIGYLRERQSA